MSSSRFRAITLVVAAALIGFGVALGTGILEDDDPSTQGDPPPATGPGEPSQPTGGAGEPAGKVDPDLPRAEDDPQGLEPGPSGPAPGTADERTAAKAARDYVAAINDRDGGAVCDAFVSSAPDELLDLPASRGSCAASFEASFGSEGKGGAPAWSSSEMTGDVSAQIDGSSARVVATVFTKYADVRQPTIEDDIIYLSRAGDRWLVVKPSATLYRAVGIADVPLDALQPPGS